MPTDNINDIEIQLRELSKLAFKIDAQTEYTQQKIEILEVEFKTISREIGRLNTEIELVKHNKDYPHLQIIVEQMRIELESLKIRQNQYALILQEIHTKATSSENKWMKLGETAYHVIIAVMIAFLVYKLGLKN